MTGIDTLIGGTRGRILKLLRASRSTISQLAETVGISGNAVRGHVAALQNDGLVAESDETVSTGGKPARIYDITPEAEELFPKGYAFVLTELIRTLEEKEGRDGTVEILRAVGSRAARAVKNGDRNAEAAVAAAADALRSIGGEVSVARVDGGWEIRGVGCPLSAVVVREPEACALAQTLIADVTGRTVTECCERTENRARCRFRVEDG